MIKKWIIEGKGYFNGSVTNPFNINLEISDIFTMMDEHSYAAFVGVLSNIYMKAHASSPFRSTPYKAAIIISESMLAQYKGQPDTTIERLIMIAESMKEPDRQIDLGFFVTNYRGMFSDTAKIGLKHTVSQCWPMVYTPHHKDIITVNLPPKQLNSGDNKVRYFDLNHIKSAFDGTTPILLDYNTPVEYVIESLSRSKVHICYQGGTAWLSVAMNIPTIIVHPTHTHEKHHVKFKLFGQDLGNINIIDGEMINHVRTHPYEYHTHIGDLDNTLKRILK